MSPHSEEQSAAASFAAVAAIGFLQSMAANALGVGVPLAIVWHGGAPFTLGLAFTAWAAGRSLMGLIAGLRFDRMGARSTLALSFLVTTGVALLYALARAPALFVVMRLCQGLAAGMYWTAILSLTAEAHTGPRRLRRLAGFNNAVALGGVAGSLLGGWIIAPFGGSAPMWAAMGLNLLLAGLALRLVRPHPGQPAARKRETGLGVRGPAAWASLTAAVSQLPSLLTNAGLPLILVRYGLGGSALGIENALMVGAALLGQTLYARHAVWGGTRAGILAPYLVGAAGLVAVGTGTGVWLFLGLAVLGSAVRLLALVWVNAVQAIAEPGHLGRATGLTRSSGDVLSALTYPFVGVAEESLGTTVAVLSMVFAASGALLFTRGTRRWFQGGAAGRLEEDAS